jgi:predicted HTH transcriptional regulator
MDDSQGKRDEAKIESQTTEWKREWKDEYLDWICGFANSQGGRLFVGIDDKGRIYGLNNRAKLLKDIPNQIRQALGIVPEVNLHSDGAGKEYLEIIVSPYPVPISVKGKYFVRSGATNQLLNGLDLDRFMQRKSGLCWESMPIPSLQMSDLDDSMIDLFLKKAISKGRIIHKDYSRGIPIQISVYDDKLYIGNMGQLPADWSLDVLLGKHVSIPFNPTIARIFYLAGYVESWGRGIEKIFTTCKNDGVPEPEYTVHPRDIMLKFKAHPDRIIPSGHTVVRADFTDTTDIFTDIPRNLTDKELAVLKWVSENNCYTSSEMAAILAVSRQTITSRLKALQEKKLISRIGSDRKGRWEIIKKLK